MNIDKVIVAKSALFLLMLTMSWSASFSESQTIVHAEYFIDTDPGVGNGLTLEAADGMFDEPNEFMIAENIESTDLPVGEHILYVRAVDQDDNWGIARQVKFNVVEANPYKKIVEAEYFIDIDPGPGNGTPLNAVDGSFEEALEEVLKDSIATDLLCPGLHSVYVRFRDNWSHWPSFNGWGLAASVQLTAYGAPCAPEHLTATPRCEYIDLSWDAAYSATSYALYQGAESIATVTGTTYRYHTSYDSLLCFWVSGKNGYGVGDASDIVCASAFPRPGTPSLSAPSDGATNRPPELDLCWDSVATQGATTYHLQVSRDSVFAEIVFSGDSLTFTCKMISGLFDGCTYWWRVCARNDCGWGPWSTSRHFLVGPVDVDVTTGNPLPDRFTLSQNRPNPFNPTTIIEFALPRTSEVEITVYDILGRRVRQLLSGNLPAGYHQITWNGRDDGGNEAASGIYFYRIQAGDYSAGRKMLLLK